MTAPAMSDHRQSRGELERIRAESIAAGNFPEAMNADECALMIRRSKDYLLRSDCPRSLPPGKGAKVEDYTLKDSRHSWAVRARKHNPPVSFEAIAEQLGNTVAVVAERYARYKMTPEERKTDGLAATKTATKTMRVKRGGKR